MRHNRRGMFVSLFAVAALMLSAVLAAGQRKTLSPMGEVSLSVVQQQAKQAKDQFPELFAFVSARDAALQGFVWELADRIPHPDALDNLSIPESPVEELLSPQDPQQCRNILNSDAFEFQLPERMRARLYWYCVNGIYVRNSSWSGLSK